MSWITFNYGIRTLDGFMNDSMEVEVEFTKKETKLLKEAFEEMDYEFERLEGIENLYDRVYDEAMSYEVANCREEYGPAVWNLIAAHLGIPYDIFNIKDISDEAIASFVETRNFTLILPYEYRY